MLYVETCCLWPYTNLSNNAISATFLYIMHHVVNVLCLEWCDPVSIGSGESHIDIFEVTPDSELPFQHQKNKIPLLRCLCHSEIMRCCQRAASGQIG